MINSQNHQLDEFGKHLRQPKSAAGGSGSGSGGGSGLETVCVCGCGKLLPTTSEPSFQNIIAGLYNQLPKGIRSNFPFGRVPICEKHCWK